MGVVVALIHKTNANTHHTRQRLTLTHRQADPDLVSLGCDIVAVTTPAQRNNTQLVRLSVSQATHVDLTVLSLRLTALPLMSTYNNAHICP